MRYSVVCLRTQKLPGPHSGSGDWQLWWQWQPQPQQAMFVNPLQSITPVKTCDKSQCLLHNCRLYVLGGLGNMQATRGDDVKQ
jgi:hypothetical protein